MRFGVFGAFSNVEHYSEIIFYFLGKKMLIIKFQYMNIV